MRSDAVGGVAVLGVHVDARQLNTGRCWHVHRCGHLRQANM